MDQIEEMKRRIEQLEQAVFPMQHPAQPHMPTVLGPAKIQCSKCPMVFELGKAYGYCCPNNDCPTQFKAR